jgi:hypothetical protein
VPDLEGSVLEQATNLSNLPFAIRHVALMPDAHAGYGMPIGGVLFADGAVVPYAIGVDIGCGVVLVGGQSAQVVRPTPPAVSPALIASWARAAFRAFASARAALVSGVNRLSQLSSACPSAWTQT